MEVLLPAGSGDTIESYFRIFGRAEDDKSYKKTIQNRAVAHSCEIFGSLAFLGSSEKPIEVTLSLEEEARVRGKYFFFFFTFYQFLAYLGPEYTTGQYTLS